MKVHTGRLSLACSVLSPHSTSVVLLWMARQNIPPWKCSVNGAIASYPCPFSMASALSLTQVCDFLTHQKISTHLSSNYLPRQIFPNEPHCRRFLSYFRALVLENRFHRRFPNPDTVQIWCKHLSSTLMFASFCLIIWVQRWLSHCSHAFQH